MSLRHDDSELPATYEERERTVELLRGVGGKLDLYELERRLDAAVVARTRGQLAVLTWDLNQLTERPEQRRRVWDSTGFRLHAAAYGLTNGFLVGTWVLTGAGFFWPFFPAASWGIGLGIHGAATNAVQRHRQRRAATYRPRIQARMQPPTQISTVREAPAKRSRIVVVVMFSDVVDSTALTRAIGDDEWSRIRARHLALLRSCYEAHQGEEVSAKGDGFLVRFASPTDAARCAVEIQRRLQGQRDGDGFALKVRIGLHSGEAVVDSNDVLGTVVNLAARVMSEAAPGEVLVTETLADQLEARFEFEDRGLRTLKGFTQPRHLLAVRWAE